MRSRRRKEESVKKDREIKEKWRVGGAVCLFSFKRAKNSQEASKKVGKEDSVVKNGLREKIYDSEKVQNVTSNLHECALCTAMFH